MNQQNSLYVTVERHSKGKKM